MTQPKKIAFITGGNRGIGFETALQLGRLGIHPVIGLEPPVSKPSGWHSM